MIRFLLSLVVLIGLAVQATAQAPSVLPNDGDRYHLIVVTQSTPTQYGQRLLSQLATDPDVMQIAERCHVHKWTPATEIYQLRYAASIPPTTLPILAVAKPSGGVIFKASGPDVPATGKAIAAALRSAAELDRSLTPRNAVEADCPACPRVPEIPQPSPRQPWRPLDQVIPDTVNITPSINLPEIPGLSYAVAGVIGIVLLFGGLSLVAIFGLATFFFLRN